MKLGWFFSIEQSFKERDRAKTFPFHIRRLYTSIFTPLKGNNSVIIEEPQTPSDVDLNGTRRSYVLVSPCRNEADFMRRTLDSIAAQSVLPSEWIVVDDGSSDATPEILREYQAKLSYLRVVSRKDRGKRSVGPGVIEAFYEGYRQISVPYEYICKLDVDLDLPPRYFETLIAHMESDPRLGTLSGKAFYCDPKSAQVVVENIKDHVSLGMTKFYRRKCFEEIGGFVREVMWDGIDCHRCRMLGWKAASLDVPELRFEHLRPMGSSQKSIYTGRKRHGYGQYFMGTSFSFMTANAILRLKDPPKLLGSLLMWWGFVESMLKGKPRYNDVGFIRYLQRWQRRSLLYGTKRATQIADDEGLEIWEKTHSNQ